MKRNFRPRRNARASTPDPSAALRDSAQKIWLAGLGALERARTDGPRVFESLVEQGRNMGARAVGAADEALKAMRQADYSGNHLEKLNQAVEERLARSLGKLGVGKEVEDLSRQVRELSESMRRFMSGAAGSIAAGADGATAPATRKRRPAGAAAKAARRRKARAGSAKAATAARSPATRTKKAPARKPRKSSRSPRAKP